ncbi:MlaD family protein [Patulibacter sp. NPDC049589]|uniref:MlaD family protein n=1 Tax=Patulibacter sp. NPDC049589 TaxID=3154731 RepID=UPI0034311394
MTSRRIATGLLAAVALVVAVLLITKKDDGYTVKVELPNSGGLKPHSSVKVAGVPGGTVDDLEITPRDTALVTLKLDDSVKPIGKGASVEVRPTDLLGERYVALDVGRQKSAPLPSGTLIPKSKTALPVELDNVINTFDGDTRERIKILVNEFGIALGNRGKDLAEVLDSMPASLTDARKLVAEIADEDASLKNLLLKGDELTATVDPKKDQLGSLVAQADTTLRELAERRDKLGRALDAAPGGLAALNRTLNQLRTASTDLRPASVDIENAAGPLKDTLDALPGFEDSARDSLKAAKTAAPALTKLGDRATAPLKSLTPTLATLRTTSGLLKPSLDQMDKRGWDDAMWFAQNMSYGLKGHDALGHYIGAALTVGGATVTSVIDHLFGGGTTVNDLVDGADPDAAIRPKSGAKKQTKSNPAVKAPQAPTTPTTTGSAAPSTAPAPETKPDRGLLGGIVDGVTGLLGGKAGTNDKPGKPTGIPGLLNSLLAP